MPAETPPTRQSRFTANAAHRRPFVEREDKEEQMQYLYKITEAIRACEVPDAHKKRFLREAIWKVTHLQRDFYGQYRSEGVLAPENEGVRIERDHVYRKQGIMDRLLNNSESSVQILSDVLHCVVTKAEHQKLTAADLQDPTVDGWKRYERCGIRIRDMSVEGEVFVV